MRKFIYPFLLPNGLLCVIIGLALSRESLPAQFFPFLQMAPFVIAVIGLLLGWRFNRTRLVYAIILLVAIDLYIVYFPDETRSQMVYGSVVLLAPLNLLLISCFRERGIFNLVALVRLPILLFPLIACGWLIYSMTTRISPLLSYQFLDVPQFQTLPLSQPLLLVNVLVLLLFAIRFLFNPAALESSFFWAQGLLFSGFCGQEGESLRLYLAGAGLILLIGTLETSHALAYRDELTGLSSRRGFNEALARLGRRYTLAILDIDHFKKVNDTYGHDVGDQVLKMVADKLSTVGCGKVFRYGGEEFAVILPRKKLKEALQKLERMRLAVEDARFILRGEKRPKKKLKNQPQNSNKQGNVLKVTISIGVAERTAHHESVSDVMKSADQALYRAKKAGRNQICS